MGLRENPIPQGRATLIATLYVRVWSGTLGNLSYKASHAKKDGAALHVPEDDTSTGSTS